MRFKDRILFMQRTWKMMVEVRKTQRLVGELKWWWWCV
jgi:hypothetical protein